MPFIRLSGVSDHNETSLQLSSDQQQQLNDTRAYLVDALAQAGGTLGFDQYMNLALYAPGAGYYVNGTRKFGVGGDFVTAPEVSSLFSQCLAIQCAQVFAQCARPQILEFGAGSGRMAADILVKLEQVDSLPERYAILELSPMLQDQQRATLMALAPHLANRVVWLATLPEQPFEGVVLANEVLDAMPVHRFRWQDGLVQEGLIAWEGDDLVERWGEASPPLQSGVEVLQKRHGPFADGYCSEINLRLSGWLQALAGCVSRGLVLLIDYGYTGAEYYHPDRHMGTLIAHFRQQAHGDLLALPGLQDLTANVDFTAVAHAGLDAGFELAGYTTQGFFLLGNGLDQLLSDAPETDLPQLTTEVKQLTLPTTMGERFKVMGLQRGLADMALNGFAMRDLREYL